MEGETVRKVINVILIIVLLGLVLGLLLAIGAETDKPSARNHSGGIDIEISKEDIPKLVEIIRIWKLADELGLDDEQLLVFLPRFKELNDLRARYYISRRKAVSDMKKLLEANPSESQVKSAVDDLRNAETKFRREERQSEDKLNSGLTVKQQAKFVVFQDVYRRDMYRLMKNLQELSNLREQRLKPQPVPLHEKKGK
jgi:hypothetical protein